MTRSAGLAGLKVLVQLIGSDLATSEDADLMSALAVEIREQEGSGRRGAAVPPPIHGLIVAEAERLVRAAEAKGRP